MFVDDKKTKKEFGSNLKSARNNRGFSVEEVAAKINNLCGDETVAIKTVYGWESGQASPSSLMLGIICKIYGISKVDELYAGLFLSEDLSTTEKKLKKEQSKENELKNKLYSKYVRAKNVKGAVDILLQMND